MKPILLGLLLTTVTLPAFGRVGERYAVCEQRLGKASEKTEAFKGCTRYLHRKGNLLIAVHVVNGTCAEETYEKLSLIEATKLLEQQFGKVWKKMPEEAKDATMWKCDGLTAIYGTRSGRLSITSAEMMRAEREAFRSTDRMEGL
jgi:hypothetical protein